MNPYAFSVIGCCSLNERGIGNKNKMVWNCPEEMKHFRETTMDSIVIMGYNTWVSIGCKSLKGRYNIVISRNPALVGDCITYKTLTDALVGISMMTGYWSDKRVFVIGGGKIYKEAIGLPYCKKIILSLLNVESVDGNDVEYDTFFPDIPLDKYELVNVENLTEYLMIQYWENIEG